MSLGKRYFVECESISVLRRFGQDDMIPLFRKTCGRVAPSADTSKAARSNALKIGWTRSKTIDSIYKTLLRFDLCPACSDAVRQLKILY